MTAQIKRRRNSVLKFLSLLSIVFVILLIIQILFLNILPAKIAIPLLAAVFILTLLVYLVYNFTSNTWATRIISGVLVIVLTATYGLGNYYIFKTNQMLASVTDLKTKLTHTVSVVAINTSEIENVDDLNGKVMGITPAIDEEGTNFGLEEVNKKATVETQEFASYDEALNALFNGSIDCLLLSEAYRGVIYDLGSYDTFNSDTKVVFQTSYQTDRPVQIADSQDAVDVTDEPFTVLISGNDSYGSLNENSRSDSNTLLTINPNTHEILMVSIPRDYYTPMACGAGYEDVCPQGEKDKLTHTGMYGVETTEATIEQMLGIEINYYFRVNFSSLVNIVDALGGINVTVEKGMEVETFYANDRLEGVHEGVNHLDGERALAYARERHAYVDGDLQRIKNQQQVLQAIIGQLSSPSLIFRYGELVDALSEAFETNMSSDDILSFIRFQLMVQPKWNFDSYALAGGDTGMYPCASVGQNASVVLPDDGSVLTASQKIQAVLNGQKASSIKDQAGKAVKKEGDEDPEEEDTQENTELSESQPVTEPDSYVSQPVTGPDSYTTYDTYPAYDAQNTYDPNALYDPNATYDTGIYQ